MFDDPAIAIHRWLSHHDQCAAAWLVNEHRSQVLRTARSWGAPMWMEDDVVQEVFLRVFRSLPRFEPRMPFAHWLSVIARNTCAKLRRHWCHRHKLSAGFEDGALELRIELQATRDEPDQHLIAKEQLLHLEHAMQQLTPRERLLLEKGSETQSPAQRVALHRARKRLRTFFDQP